MGILDNFQNLFNNAGDKAKKTYDIKKIQLKINGYKKELKALYAEVGKYQYTCNQKNIVPDENKVQELFNNITNINYRIITLNKQIEESNTNSTSSTKETENYVTPVLKVKTGDIKLKRVSHDVTLVRVCPKCSHENDPSFESCKECGHILKA